MAPHSVPAYEFQLPIEVRSGWASVCVYLLLAGKTHATWQMDATLGEIVSM
jgi:hypothetical protein